ncbi:cob(I)yrinic acid a,c-diamide adenosyltransferase [Clostridium sp. BSD9I1]|uniref:cob(I)yrinic acid a,c-diamide adenosyltransferase n=1 Tax=Clostridium sp. BSD9I1 TaxID=2003589 RepID=UPI0016464017|nr:cob(I)yrinic acid a,c-diamide adenosyltransferase [Clostridium sp. BSD9I1]
MSKIYTRTGDKGSTALFGGSRAEKDSLKVEAYGTIDELISTMGAAYSFMEDEKLKTEIIDIQKKLFVLGAELASDENGMKYLKEVTQESDIDILEKIIDKYMENAGAFKGFVTPGKNRVSAMLHVARTVARRAERVIITLGREDKVREEVKKYVNRLSDALYAMARFEEER